MKEAFNLTYLSLFPRGKGSCGKGMGIKMKKNLLTVLILALLIVNIILTSIMMFSVMGTNKKTASLVGNIATVLNLEWKQPGEQDMPKEVSLADTQVHDLTGAMTIPLADEGNGQTYMVCNVALSMNKKHADYKTYGETISERESLIKDVIISVITEHTESECRNNLDGLKAEILEAIQQLFDSDFIYNVAISDVKYGGSSK